MAEVAEEATIETYQHAASRREDAYTFLERSLIGEPKAMPHFQSLQARRRAGRRK
jgi:hypothetical protein